MIRAGKLDRVIAIERQSEFVFSTGEVRTSWATIGTVRAELIEQTSAERQTGYGETESETIAFRIRYMPNITTADRIRYAGKHYDLKAITEIARRRGLELSVVAVK